MDFSVYDDLFEPVFVEDLFGKIVYFNSGLLSLLKLTPRYFKKNDECEDFVKKYLPPLFNEISNLKKNDFLLTSELTFKLEDSELTIIVKAKKIEDCYHYYLKDMSVEKQLYDKYKIQLIELKNTHAQIIQSDKLKVIGEMTANISHEINNPLTVILGNSEMIEFTLDSSDLNKEKEQLVLFNDNISKSANRIIKIISNMKEFLHQNEEEKEYYGASEIIQTAISFLGPRLNRTNIPVHFHNEANDPIIFVNKTKMEQVIVNLLQNAVDALVDAEIKSPQIEVRINSEIIPGHIAIDFIDNGPGISEANKEKIFQTFFTTKEIGKGTGLGLSISNRILETHQGKLELIESNSGATFRVILPSVSISSYMSGGWEKMYSSIENYKKVLVIDNEPSILNLCKSFLKTSDFYFLGSTSAKEAFELLARLSVDLIITDIKMPDVNGIDFAKALRQKGVNTPIYYMTSKDSLEKFNQTKDELNISGLIIKPFSKDEFIKSIEVGINGKK